MNLQIFGKTTFYDIQKEYLLPTIDAHWKKEQTNVVSSLQGKAIQLAGDGRCDSPGFLAKYCTYTMIDNESLKIVDFEVVQVTKAKSAVGMEKIGFETTLDRLTETGQLVITDVSTDRHVQIRKLMREKYVPLGITHNFDPYNLVNRVRKKLTKKQNPRSLWQLVLGLNLSATTSGGALYPVWKMLTS